MNKYLKIALGLICLTSCSEKDFTHHQSNRSLSIQACMPQNSTTRVSVSQKSGSKDLIPKWKEGDMMKFYAYDNKGEHGSIRIFHIGNSVVEDVSEDGSTGRFSITYPTDSSFDPWDKFSLIGISGKESTVEGREIRVESSAFRSNIADFNAPVWFIEKEIGTSSITSNCKHYGVYEVLHITNKSQLSISLKFKGYEADKLWYRDKSTFLPITNYYSDKKEVPEIVNTDPPVQFLLPNETAVFVSWYSPLDIKLKDVTLVVDIDGNEVRTGNKKSSDVKMQIGHAYHMYATWNGKSLNFENGENIEYGEFTLSDNICSVKINEEKTIQIKGGSGDFDISCDNASIANVLLNDFKLSIKGISAGIANIIVHDRKTDVSKEIRVYVSGGNGNMFICHNKIFDGVSYRIYKLFDRSKKISNSDGTLFYKSSLVLETSKDGIITTHTIGDDLYLADGYWNGMIPCVLIDASLRQMFIFINSKTNSRDYSENGYMYQTSLDNIDFKRETVFSNQNWGWFSYFKGYENGKICLSHFNYSGYYEMKSLRSNDGKWTTSSVKGLNPSSANNNWNNANLFLILDSGEAAPNYYEIPIVDESEEIL